MFSTTNAISRRGPTRFFILAAGRTGSTRLRLLIDSHPLALCHGEVFGENLSTLAEPGSEAHRRLLQERASDPAGFARHHIFAIEGKEAVGFKILYHQLTDAWPGLMASLAEDRGIRVVHLVRRNGLKRFLSEYFVGTVTRKNLFLKNEEIPALPAVEIPPAVLLANLESIEAESERMRGIFRDHQLHELAYEESLEDNGPVLRGVLDFLGLPPAELSVGIKKILPDDPKVLIENFDEVAAALRGTRFEWMLHE
jgi:hypothetical protein